MQTQTIVFIGPQGSGKGTQVANITDYLNEHTHQKVVNIETGKAFRDLAKTDTYTAKRVKELLDEGQMIPNFLTTAFVTKFLIRELTADSHVTMDGFPRNLGQVAFLNELMTFYKRPNLTVVYINATEEVVIKRLQGRGRFDDTPELIAERLRYYYENTTPIIEAYRQREDVTFIEVDGASPIESVTEAIVTGLPGTE